MLEKCILCDCELQETSFSFDIGCYKHPVDYIRYYAHAWDKEIIAFRDKSGKYLCRWSLDNLDQCRLENDMFVNISVLDFKSDFNSALEKLKSIILFS